MGNQLAGSDDGWKTVSFKVRPDELADFDTAVENSDHDNRSEALRELVRENADDSNDRVWLPGREDLREDYRVCLDIANENLIINVRAHGSTLAQKLGQSKDDLHAALKPLEREGFVRRQVSGFEMKEPNVAYRVKPKCADPEQWIYRHPSINAPQNGGVAHGD